MSNQNCQVGDIFKFKIAEKQQGYGQVVAIPTNNFEYLAIFDVMTSQNLDIRTIVSSRILIVAQVIKSKFDTGDWQMIGNAPVVITKKMLPEYKILSQNEWIIVNYDNKIIRKATDDDLLVLKSHKTYSPAALEYAVKAHFGLVEYKEFCDELIKKKPN